MTKNTRASDAVEDQALDEVVRDAMAEWQIPGVTVAILHDGESEIHGYGVISLETDYPTRPDTLFQIGSNSKVFTATLVMRLVEDGLLDLDAPIGTWLPDLTLADPGAAATITLRQLLSHTSGLEGDRFEGAGEGDDALARYVAGAADWAQETPPGEFWSYCNSGFGIAGRIIEVITGTSFEAAMQERVFAPPGIGSLVLLRPRRHRLFGRGGTRATARPGCAARRAALSHRPPHAPRRRHYRQRGRSARVSALPYGGRRRQRRARPRSGVDPRHAGAPDPDRRRGGLGHRLVATHPRWRADHPPRRRDQRAYHPDAGRARATVRPGGADQRQPWRTRHRSGREVGFGALLRAAHARPEADFVAGGTT